MRFTRLAADLERSRDGLTEKECHPRILAAVDRAGPNLRSAIGISGHIPEHITE